MYTITDKGINILISAVEQHPNQYFWIRTPDMLQQIYISTSFNDAWGRSDTTLFEQPMSFMSTLVYEEKRDVSDLYEQRVRGSQEDRERTILSRIYSADHSVLYLRDACFSLYDSYGNVLGAAGVGEIITESEWFCDLEGKIKEPCPLELLKQSHHARHVVADKPEAVADLNVVIPCKKIKSRYYISTMRGEVELTRRQLECVCCFFEGMTAKQTAKYLQISQFTVEEYLLIVREKLGCHSKLEFAKLIKHTVR